MRGNSADVGPDRPWHVTLNNLRAAALLPDVTLSVPDVTNQGTDRNTNTSGAIATYELPEIPVSGSTMAMLKAPVGGADRAFARAGDRQRGNIAGRVRVSKGQLGMFSPMPGL